jgi:branched-chain amino acid transport system substrate-binding protein
VKGFKKIAVLYQTNDYSTALKNAFVNKAKELGITIVAVEAYNETTQDFKPMLSKFRLMGPDALFVPGYADQAKLVAAQTKGLLSVPMFGADGLDNDIMLEIPEANGTFVTTPFLTEVANDEAKAFIKAYEAAYGSTPNYMGANAYDAVDMAFKAAIAAKGDRTAVRDWLASHNSAEKAYQGVTGATFFDENGDCLKPAFVKVIDNGAWKAAEQQLQ